MIQRYYDVFEVLVNLEKDILREKARTFLISTMMVRPREFKKLFAAIEVATRGLILSHHRP
jgi:hypothetical protein